MSLKLYWLFILLILPCILYTYDARTFLSSFIKENELVFDVGAHIGKKTEEYLQLGAHVVCIEPQPDCCVILQQKFSNNPHITIVPKGLADHEGILQLAICSKANTISTFSEEWRTQSRFTNYGYKWDTFIPVPVTTLDNLIQQYGIPVFCKIDVENFEYQVLKGLSQPIPMISIEYAIETLHNTEKCINHLEQLGYKEFNFIIGESYHLVSKEWLSSKEILQKIKYVQETATDQKIKYIWGDIYVRYVPF